MGDPSTRPNLRVTQAALANLLDSYASGTSASDASSLQSVLKKNPGLTLAAAWETMDPAYRRSVLAQTGEHGLQEILSLAKSPLSINFLSEAKVWGQRRQQEGKIEAAAAMWRQLAQWAQSEDGAQMLGGAGSDLLRAVQGELTVLTGGGGFGSKWENFSLRLLGELSDPWVLLGFGVGGAVYQGTRLSALGLLARRAPSLLTRGRGAWLGASALGIAAEAPALVLTVKGGHEFSGISQDWSGLALRREVLSAGLMLFFLKGSGGIVQNSAAGAWKHPLSASLAGQAGMYSGILLAHRAEAALGWREKQTMGEDLQGAALTLLQFNIGAGLANRLSPRWLSAWQRRMQIEQRLFLENSPRFPPSDLFGSGNFQTAPALAPKSRINFSPPQPLLIPAPILMASGQDGSGGKFTGKVVPINGGKESPSSLLEGGTDRPQPEPLSVEELVGRASHLIQVSENALSGLEKQMNKLELRLQIFLGHQALGRGKMAEVGKALESDRFILDEIRGGIDLLPDLNRDLQSLSFAVRADPQVHDRVKELRTVLNRIWAQRNRVEEILQGIEGQWSDPKVREIQNLLYAFSSLSGALNGSVPGYNRRIGLSLTDELFFHRSHGMLRALPAKEAFRPSPEQEFILEREGRQVWLKAGSPRAQETEWAARLFYDLQRARPPEDYRSILLARKSTPESKKVREGLAQSGIFEDPFRAWLPVYLPVLLAANGGKMDRLMTHLKPVLPFLDEANRSATPVTVWWLSQALQGTGNPAGWTEEFFKEVPDGPSRELVQEIDAWIRRDSLTQEAAQNLASRGPVGSLALALHHFLRFPFDRDLAMQLALQAPESVREDVVGLTAALLGAFHGDGFFSPDVLIQKVMDHSLGDRGSELGRQRIEQVMAKFSRLDSSLDALPDLWAQAVNPHREIPVLIPLPGAGGPPHLVLTPFEQARQDGQIIVMELEEWVRSGKREGMSSVEALALRVSVGRALERFHEIFLEMGDFSLVPEGPQQNRLLHSMQQVRDAQIHLRAISELLRGRLEGDGASRFSEEELSLLREQILAMRFALQLGEGEASLWVSPQPFGPTEIKEVYDHAAKAGKSLPPPGLNSPFHDIRSDWATAQVLLNQWVHLETFKLALMPTLENLSELYMEALGIPPARLPYRSLAETHTLSGLLSAVTPAFLHLNHSRPDKAYRELRKLPLHTEDRKVEAWRGVTFLTLRLLEGAEPGKELLGEARRFFKKSPWEKFFERAAKKTLGLAPAFKKEKPAPARPVDPVGLAFLGVRAFFTHPKYPKAAVELAQAWTPEWDREQIPVRVARLLVGAMRGSDKAVDSVIPRSSKSVPDFTKIIADAFPQDSDRGELLSQMEAWAASLGHRLSEAEKGLIYENLNQYPDFFIHKMVSFGILQPTAARGVLVGLKIISEGSPLRRDPVVLAELNQKAKDVIPREDLDAKIWEILWVYESAGPDFFPDSYRKISQEEKREWEEKLADLSPAYLKTMSHYGFMRPGMVLLLLNGVGISSTGMPDTSLPPIR